MTCIRILSALCALSVLLGQGAWPPLAHADHGGMGGAHSAPAQSPPAAQSPASSYFGDIPLVNQNGEQMRFYSDLLRGKVVVIHSFFSGCEGSCPVVIDTFARVQDWLGERLGTQVYLLSLSVDPETDTPATLKAYAERLKAKAGWYFLTGEKPNVERALFKLGQYVEDRESHSNVILIGNDATGLWKKAFGLASPEEIIRLVESVLQDRG